MRFLSFARVRILLRTAHVVCILPLLFASVLFFRFQQVGTADGTLSGDAMNVDVVSTDAETSAQVRVVLMTLSTMDLLQEKRRLPDLY